MQKQMLLSHIQSSSFLGKEHSYSSCLKNLLCLFILLIMLFIPLSEILLFFCFKDNEGFSTLLHISRCKRKHFISFIQIFSLKNYHKTIKKQRLFRFCPIFGSFQSQIRKKEKPSPRFVLKLHIHRVYTLRLPFLRHDFAMLPK